MDFNTAAANWDTEKRVQRAKIISDEIAGAISFKEQMHALDFGCGTGLLSFFLQDRFRHITLVDTSKGMIDVVKQKIYYSDIRNMTALQADFIMEPLPEDSFDVVYTSMVLHHIKDIEATLKSLYMQIKQGGQLFIVDLTEEDGSFHNQDKEFDGHNGFDQNYLKLVMEKVGYTNVKSHIFYEDIKSDGDLNIPYTLFIMVGEK